MLNQGTVDSFQLAAEIFKEATNQGEDIHLGLLINDIGTNCGEDHCAIRETSFDKKTFSLPPRYIEALVDLKIHPRSVKFYWEKHIRNRASLEIKRRQLKSHRNDIIKDAIGYWLIKETSPEKILLTRNKIHTPYGLPACPLIMGAYFLFQESQGYGTTINVWYVATDNSKNVPSHFLIEKGASVAKAFGTKIQIKNIYITERGLMMGAA